MQDICDCKTQEDLNPGTEQSKFEFSKMQVADLQYIWSWNTHDLAVYMDLECVWPCSMYELAVYITKKDR